MNENKLNICQVSLSRDIPLILENFRSFKKFYNSNLKFYIICPENQFSEFKEKLNFEEINLINENDLISFKKFQNIFDKYKDTINYEKEFIKRLSWYYQQVLKITFSLKFITENKKKIVIWDADTIILKKIKFFNDDLSIKYGNFFEFHKEYYITNKYILNKLPNYFISFLNQFIAISEKECLFFIESNLKFKITDVELGEKISQLIFKSIFTNHKIYNGSMFSEYELIGQSNYKLNSERQKPLLYLRFGLDGKLTDLQKKISILLGYKHVTYEHSHPNLKSIGMLNRKQTWYGFVKMIVKNFFKFYLRYIKHIVMYALLNKKKI